MVTMSNWGTYILNPLGFPLAVSLTSNMLGTLNDRFETWERCCEKKEKCRILPPSYVTPGSTVPLVCFSTCTANCSAKLYLLIVSLNKPLKRNKLESQCRYHKCIIEQKQTKVTNLLVGSDMKSRKQNSVTNFKIIKQYYALHGLSKCSSAGKATDKQHLERESTIMLSWTQRYKGTYIRNAFLNMIYLGRENLTCLQITINETYRWQQWHRWN